jgi:hypothetical protein
MAADVPFAKQELPQRRGRPARAAQYAGLNPENACKWRVLNKLYQPDDKEWQAAADADSWDDATIVKRIRTALDTAWAIEQATTARQKAELQIELQRVARQYDRTEQRHQQARPLKDFLRSKNLVIVHESSRPAEPDELETENPLSLAYKGRRKRQRGEGEEEELEQSPPVDEALAEEAADHGVQIVSPHKAKRRALAGVSPAAVADAEEVLEKLTPAAAKVLLEKVVKKGGASGAAAAGGKGAGKKAKAKAAASRAKDAQLRKTYYEKQLKTIDGLRKRQKHGPLNKAGRKDLKKFCGFHYKDVEVGFAGSLARPWWNKYVTDWARFPDATEDDEEDSETDEEEEE